MIDVHVHLKHKAECVYTQELLENIVSAAIINNIDEIYILEHTHQFIEFKRIYEPVSNFNEYQCDWLVQKMTGTIEDYLNFIETAKRKTYPVKIKFGLEVCYIPMTENLLGDVLDQFKFDFLTGSVHYVDNWGFDHKAEFWKGINVDKVYKRYYEIMTDLIKSRLFDGVAHPDSIKCFKFLPSYDLSDTYRNISALLNIQRMFAEQSGGLTLNYGYTELGMNPVMLKIFRDEGVRIFTASDAHKPEHAGANIFELKKLIENA